ncbi:MAG: hypothetical protein IKX95_07285 [Lachnospiraceae bacterium]|nr:hypothetical protein [Lachnospiraceae bacterium]MBR5766566.1 hypothetical protein [Lachnospiraceae bacterium]MBR6468909.1 hypothetical protein [Lachnospiraceae bacterium]MBR6485100.1 hypothetical protein [Lachnospiraceae bacterium]
MKIQKKKPTQINLMIRCIIAMYLIYLAHGLISELGSSDNPKLMAGFAILFTFTGVLIIAFAIKAFVNKEYTDMNEIESDEQDKTEATEGTVIDELITDDAVIDERKDIKDDTHDETGE